MAVAGQAQGPLVPETLQKLVAPHIESFDYFIGEGLQEVVQGLPPVEIEHPLTHVRHKIWFENPSIARPVKEGGLSSADDRLFPRDCREGCTSYRAALHMDVCYQLEGGAPQRFNRRFGLMPIMVKSKACYLRDMDRASLVKKGEESTEMGGYFICNGIERIIRMIVLQRRHYIMALRRGAYKKRGSNYTEAATSLRCVRPDELSATVRCHYLTDGTVNFAFTVRRAEYFIPAGVLLNTFLDVSDRELFHQLLSLAPQSEQGSSFVAERAELLLRQAQRYGLQTRTHAIQWLGSHFRVVFDLPDHVSDYQAGEQLLREYVFIHLTSPSDKLALLLQMLAKLYALVDEQCCEDNPDAPTSHELLLPGHLLMRFAREKLEDCLLSLKDSVQRDAQRAPESVNLQVPAELSSAGAHVDLVTRNHLRSRPRPSHTSLLFPDVVYCNSAGLPIARVLKASWGFWQMPQSSILLQDEAYLKRIAERMPDVGRKMEYMLNTGNLVSKSGLDLSQASGFTVVAEKLNFFRYLSHFRSVHRGAYFAQLRTTAVRKLLPESWGFLCPVHTPDGSPCGLLTHLTAACRLVTAPPANPPQLLRHMAQILAELGMAPLMPAVAPPSLPAHLPVHLDGKVMGTVASVIAPALVSRLRTLKAARLVATDSAAPPVGNAATLLEGIEHSVPADVEVVYLPYQRGGPYPGIFLFTEAARMMRPVQQLPGRALELIGTLEQGNMAIRCPDGSGAVESGGMRYTHSEVHTGAMLSVVASLTPYSDFNQSPRNMYQCQMGKQTMGTPVQAWQHRADGKLYRLHTPQTPIARTNAYNKYAMDEFPSGTNAIVAVLAYTGYDMEDAMILNKSSMERGLAHGTIVKCENINLREDRGKEMVFGTDRKPPSRAQPSAARPQGAFGQRYPINVPPQQNSSSVKQRHLAAPAKHPQAERVDADGLPHVGAVVWPKQSYYTTVDTLTNRAKQHELKGEETAVVSQVTIVGSGRETEVVQASIKMRLNRNPVIGDKFSSRHGQKGVLSQLWPDVDMPYSAATGMRPDLIINPHAFPSRMTIGMLVESMASKAGALNGKFVDATPFQRSDGKEGDPIREFGEQLEAAGFNYHGGETMISGITGEEFQVDIFVGPVYYQRLRHMVSDKFQVRSTGPVNPLTRQPIKGRKFGGGIRFGEMERDSLLAHGAAYLLHDRLHTCSDYSVMDVCTRCGSLLSPARTPAPAPAAFGSHPATHALSTAGQGAQGKTQCRLCGSTKDIERVALPYVFRYLAAELAGMNIKCSLQTDC